MLTVHFMQLPSFELKYTVAANEDINKLHI